MTSRIEQPRLPASTDFHRMSTPQARGSLKSMAASSESFRDEYQRGGSSSSRLSSAKRRMKEMMMISSNNNRRGQRKEPLMMEKQSSITTPNNNDKVDDAESAFGPEEEEEEVYFVRQEYGYMSILFSVVQCIILALMMWQCGIAPMNINPMIGPYPDALSEWGGKNSVLILEDDQWIRLMTPILLHAGLIHLFCNIMVQLETGLFFEREWGSWRWLVIYLSSALGSSILSVIMMPDAVSVGSSGAVMGLFGGKAAEVLMRMCEREDTEQAKIGHQVRKEQCMAVSCSVILVMAFSFIPYVDWAAHLGGLVAGLVVGIVIFSWDMHVLGWRLVWSIVGLILTVSAFTVALAHMYSGEIEASEELRDVCGYYQQNFDDYECNCMREEYLNNMNNQNSGDQ